MQPADRRHFKLLSAVEATRALYIDFEGEKDKPPVLLGVLRRPGRGVEPSVHQVVVDREFDVAGPSAREFRDALEVVAMRAEHGDRRIVSWSEYGLEVVRRLRAVELELAACPRRSSSTRTARSSSRSSPRSSRSTSAASSTSPARIGPRSRTDTGWRSWLRLRHSHRVARIPSAGRPREVSVMSNPLSKVLLDSYVPQVRALLVRAAADGRLIYYMEIASQYGGRGYFGQVLDALNRAEHAKGNPLISALVVSRATKQPSDGFFLVAEELGLYRRGSNRRGFWENQRDRVWNTDW